MKKLLILASIALFISALSGLFLPVDFHITSGHHRVGSAPLPYGFYQLLKILTCITACYSASKFRDNSKWLWTMICIAILFNPIRPIKLDKELWNLLDIISGLIFIRCLKINSKQL